MMCFFPLILVDQYVSKGLKAPPRDDFSMLHDIAPGVKIIRFRLICQTTGSDLFFDVRRCKLFLFFGSLLQP